MDNEEVLDKTFRKIGGKRHRSVIYGTIRKIKHMFYGLAIGAVGLYAISYAQIQEIKDDLKDSYRNTSSNHSYKRRASSSQASVVTSRPTPVKPNNINYAREIELGKKIHHKDPSIKYMIYVDKTKNKTKLVDLLSSRTLYSFSSTDGLGGSGPKKEKGDHKTPEGIYCLDYIRTDYTYNPLYGAIRFGINYPNYHDRSKGRTGSLLLICGTGIDGRIKAIDSGRDVSYGAVVLKDSSIKNIYNTIKSDLDDVIVAIEDSSRKLKLSDYDKDIRRRY